MSQIIYRKASLNDLEDLMEIKESVNWNQTITDWAFFLEYFPEYCLVAEAENQVVGTVTAVEYAKKLAWIGMMIVAEKYRGQGISQRLMADIIDKLRNIPAIKLDATIPGRQVYQKLDFKDEYVLSRMVSQFLALPEYDDYEENISVVYQWDLPAMAAYDQQKFGANRMVLFDQLYNNAPYTFYKAIKRGKVTGYIMSRKGSNFNQVGPLVANNFKDAKNLLIAALSEPARQAETIVVDVMCDQPAMVSLLKRIGFEEERKFTRMYYQTNQYPGKPQQVYLAAGPEYG